MELQAVNAAHEFKIRVTPQEDDLKQLVHVTILFKQVPLPSLAPNCDTRNLPADP